LLTARPRLPAPRPSYRGTLCDAVRKARLFHQQLDNGSIGVDLASVVDVSGRAAAARAAHAAASSSARASSRYPLCPA
jgi:hypothetical protein